MCNEPMMGVCFIIDDIEISKDFSKDIIGTERGQIMSAIKGKIKLKVLDGCLESFTNGSRRLIEAMYRCDIQSDTDSVGKIFPVINKRRANIFKEDFDSETGVFTIQSYLPVTESFGLASDLRDKTSGAASPQLMFSHWEILNIDPYFIPTTEEEIEDFGGIEQLKG
jgi:ribosome assembly protein 1